LSTDPNVHTVKNISNIKTNLKIELTKQASSTQEVIYQLRKNESLQFYAPNLIDNVEYSNYVKFEYYVRHDIPANSQY